MKADLRHLRYFLAAADHGQFGGAARALGVQQPTVSRHVIELEDRLGVSLFDRHARGVRLTRVGRTFADDARRLFSDLENAERRALRAGRAETGVLRVTFYSSLAGGRLAGLLRSYRDEAPEVEVVLFEADPVHQVGLLVHERVDVAIVAAASAKSAERYPNLDSAHWWSEPMFVVMPEGHPLAACASLHWTDLRDEPFVVRALETGPVLHNWLAQRLDPKDCLPDIRQHEVSREGLLGLVEAGFGLAVASEPTTHVSVPGVVYRPIEEDNAVIEILAAWLPTNVNPVLRRFLSFAAEALKRDRRQRAPMVRP